MGSELPDADQPDGLGLVPVSEEEALDAVLAANPPRGAWDTAWRFREAVTREYGPDLSSLTFLVTPESLPAWGDFGRARDMLAGTGMMSGTQEPSPGIAYVRFIEDPGLPLYVDGDIPVEGRAIATLVFREETGEWQVHGLGDYLRADELPAGIF